MPRIIENPNVYTREDNPCVDGSYDIEDDVYFKKLNNISRELFFKSDTIITPPQDPYYDPTNQLKRTGYAKAGVPIDDIPKHFSYRFNIYEVYETPVILHDKLYVRDWFPQI